MEVKKMKNIVLTYEPDDWNTRKSKRLSIKHSALATLAVAIGIVDLVICVRLGIRFNHTQIGLFTGLIIMMLHMICLLSFAEKWTYAKEIAGFRFIDWLTVQNNVRANYESGEIVLEHRNGVEQGKVRLTSILKNLGCSHKIKYPDGHKIFTDNTIRLYVNATDKELLTINVERLG